MNTPTLPVFLHAMNRYPYGLSIKEIGLITYNKEIYVLSPIVFWHITANQYNIKRQSNHYDIFASNVWDPFIFVIIIYLAIKLLLFFPLLSRSMMTARPLWLPNGQYKNSMIWMMSIEVYRASSSSLAAPPSRPRPLVSKTIYPAICLRGARNKSRLFYLERLYDFPPARLNL